MKVRRSAFFAGSSAAFLCSSSPALNFSASSSLFTVSRAIFWSSFWTSEARTRRRQLEFRDRLVDFGVDLFDHRAALLALVLLLHRLAEHVAELLDRLDPGLFGQFLIGQLNPALNALDLDRVVHGFAGQGRFPVIGRIFGLDRVFFADFGAGQRRGAAGMVSGSLSQRKVLSASSWRFRAGEASSGSGKSLL